MELNPPRGLPSHPPDPARPAVVPMLPTRRPPGKQGPLPDPVAVRRVPVPDCAPPYDGEQVPGPAADPGGPPGQGEAPMADRARSPAGQGGPPGLPPAASDDRAVQPREAPPEPPAAPGWSRRAEPGPGGWPSQFAQALAEALAGSRPAQQLNPWTTEQTRQQIRQLSAALATGQRPRVRRLMTSAPACDVLELTAVVGFGPRIRVLAVRLERTGSTHWRCTAIESA